MDVTLKCPNCGGEILVENTYDTWYGKSHCVLYHIGTCKTCRHTISWDGIYTFAENINIIDIEPEQEREVNENGN